MTYRRKWRSTGGAYIWTPSRSGSSCRTGRVSQRARDKESGRGLATQPSHSPSITPLDSGKISLRPRGECSCWGGPTGEFPRSARSVFLNLLPPSVIGEDFVIMKSQTTAFLVKCPRFRAHEHSNCLSVCLYPILRYTIRSKLGTEIDHPIMN